MFYYFLTEQLSDIVLTSEKLDTKRSSCMQTSWLIIKVSQGPRTIKREQLGAVCSFGMVIVSA